MNHVLETLKKLNGYYECPKDKDGNRLGPLVGYAGTYESAGLKKQYVGDTYVNFAKADQWPIIMNQFASQLVTKLPDSLLGDFIDVVCGPQMGGVSIAQMVALQLDCQYACIEKKITAFETAQLREQSKLIFSRHSISPGQNIVVAEDVVNNFSTTKTAIELIESKGAKVVGIIALLNRSPNLVKQYVYEGREIPVISLVEMEIPEWKQEDPAVIEDVKAGNIVLKPKDEWDKLVIAMEEAND